MNIKLTNSIRIELNNTVSHDGKLEISNINIDNVKYAIGYTADKMRDFRKYMEQLISIQLDNELSTYFESNKNNKEIIKDTKFYDIPDRPSQVIESNYIQVSYEKILSGVVIIYKSTDNYYSHREYLEYDLINGTFNTSILYKMIPMRELKPMLIMYQYDINTVSKGYKQLIDILNWFKDKKSCWILFKDNTRKKLEDMYTIAITRYDMKNITGFKYKNKIFNVNSELLNNLLSKY